MNRRSLIGLDSSNICPRRLRSGNRYAPLPGDIPRFQSTEPINTPAASNGVFSGSVVMDLYTSPLFRPIEGRFGIHVGDSRVGIPRPLREQVYWDASVSFFISLTSQRFPLSFEFK